METYLLIIFISAFNSVTHQLQIHVYDYLGKKFSPEDKIFLTDFRTVNSSGEIKMDSLGDMIYPEVGIIYSRRGDIVVDGFNGQSRDNLREFTMSFKSLNDVMSDDHG